MASGESESGIMAYEGFAMNEHTDGNHIQNGR